MVDSHAAVRNNGEILCYPVPPQCNILQNYTTTSQLGCQRCHSQGTEHFHHGQDPSCCPFIVMPSSPSHSSISHPNPHQGTLLKKSRDLLLLQTLQEFPMPCSWSKAAHPRQSAQGSCLPHPALNLHMSHTIFLFPFRAAHSVCCSFPGLNLSLRAHHIHH